MMKKGLIYVNPDGKPSNQDVVASGMNGDCAVLKNGTLICVTSRHSSFARIC
jgi:hypothetical protein